MDPVVCGYCNKVCNATCSDWEDGRTELDSATNHFVNKHKSYEYNQTRQDPVTGERYTVRVRSWT